MQCLYAIIVGVTDRVTIKVRSKIMSSVGTRNTAPELIVRRLLHAEGYRYRLHQADLPGKPDLVFPSRKAVIYVHGCFWHGHGCAKGKLPKSRLDYWQPKIAQNRLRDKLTVKRIRAQGWKVLVVWQCETKLLDRLQERVTGFLDGISDSTSRRKK